MIRILSRLVAKIGGLLIRISRLMVRTPRDKRIAVWSRDGGDRTLRLDYDLSPDSVVFDVGGYDGQWSSDLFGRYGCRIELFEAVPQFAANTARRFARNVKIRVHPFGLGARSEAATIMVDGPASSTSVGVGNAVEIWLIRASQFIEDSGIAWIDLMKVNIEGGEFDLLEDLIESGLAKRVRNFQIQFHEFIPDAERRMIAIQRKLEVTHVLTWQYVFVWENWQLRK